LASRNKKNRIYYSNPKNLNTKQELEFFKENYIDVVIVVAYGQIIPKSFLDKVKFGFINIHASLLPKWRGAAPIQRAIMNRDKKTGISIMKIVEKLDSGPILKSEELVLDENITHGDLEKKLAVLGSNLIIESLKDIQSGRVKFIEQLHSKATYAKKIDKSETKISWSLNANEILAHIHGLSPSPGAWFEYQDERFKILRAKISAKKGIPGSIVDENLTIACASNSIQILELQRQGKNKQTAKEFLLGKKIIKDTILV